MPLVLKKYKQLGNFHGVIICSLCFVYYKTKVKNTILFSNHEKKSLQIFFFAFFWLSKILTYFNPKIKWGDCHETYFLTQVSKTLSFEEKKFEMSHSIVDFFVFFLNFHLEIFRFSKNEKLKKKRGEIFNPFFFLCKKKRY